ncbi:unnamed protein product [Effrenium voratum]|nr:unnamed protein product [Effrenium voratum]
MEEMKIQVSKGNEHYSKLRDLEQDIQTFEDESELLTLGLHEAENRSGFLQKEHELLQAGVPDGRLQQWAKEVQGFRVAAKLQTYEDELQHWQQVAEGQADPPHARSHQQAAEELLGQKAAALEEQLSVTERRLREMEQQEPEEVPGHIRSVPCSLHGALFGPNLSGKEGGRRALVIGCNYTNSFAPLQGSANDAWNVQCLLRQTLQYSESQVRCLVDFWGAAAPPKRRPTRDNIISELQWLTGNARPGDNIFLYFSGYGAQQPSHVEGLYEGHLVPADYADNLPEEVLRELASAELPPDWAQRAAAGYRLVPMSLITSALHALPSGCKATVVLDCCQASVLPLLKSADVRSVLAGPGPPLFQRLRANASGEKSRQRLLNLPPLPHSSSRPSASPSGNRSTPMGSPSMQARQPGEAQAAYHGPCCKCYCFATCQNDQVCCELPIEGTVQGAGTWAFVKAVAACHFSTSLTQHSKAMDSILQNLRRKYRWIQQTPVIQLSAAANVEDALILP